MIVKGVQFFLIQYSNFRTHFIIMLLYKIIVGDLDLEL